MVSSYLPCFPYKAFAWCGSACEYLYLSRGGSPLNNLCLLGRYYLGVGDFNLISIDWSLESLSSNHFMFNDRLFYECFLSLGLYSGWRTPLLSLPLIFMVLHLVFTSGYDRFGGIQILPPL